MLARDVMTSPVVTVAPSATVHEITQLLLERHISGVPVVEAGELVGIVSKSDLLHRYETEPGGTPPAPWWGRWVQRSGPPRRYVRSHGTRAADIMTPGPVSIGDDVPLARVAYLLGTYRIQRLPVVRRGRLVGIVTSGDLVHALHGHEADPACAEGACDEDIRVRLAAELERQEWWNPLWSRVCVTDGIVSFHGMLGNEAEREAARVAAEGIGGVRGVIDERVRANDWQMMF